MGARGWQALGREVRSGLRHAVRRGDVTLAGGRLVVDGRTFACGVDKRRASLGGLLGSGAAASFPVGGRERRRADPRDAHEVVSPPAMGAVVDLFFLFLGKPTTCRHHEQRLVEGAEKWLPSEVVRTD